jgi:5,5'-dehydrodivanillate O-demethylase
MLTQEENELLTRVGPGTPCGELMRWYWHPIAATVHLDENPVRKVRLLCEDLTLYRDRSGTLGLIGQRCPHRSVDLVFGIPEQTGLRCPYHGWLFDESGRCLEQPLEPADSSYKDRVSIKSYRVQELGGLIWAYLGKEPAPLLPRWDLLVEEHCFRQILGTVLPCNWLQVAENRRRVPCHLSPWGALQVCAGAPGAARRAG